MMEPEYEGQPIPQGVYQVCPTTEEVEESGSADDEDPSS